MWLGMHFQSDDYTGEAFPAATFLDLGGSVPGMKSPERMVRLFHRGRPDPRIVGHKAHGWWSRWDCRVQVHNEVNLAEEWENCTPEAHEAWFLEVCQHANGAAIYLTPPSPGVPGWHAYLTDKCVEAASGLCCHAYGRTLDELKGCVLPFLGRGKPVWIGETNFGAGNKIDDLAGWIMNAFVPFLRWCAEHPEIEAVCWFAYWWDRSGKLPTSVDAKDTAIEALMRTRIESKEVPVATDLKALAQEKARRYRIDWPILDRQVQAESSWNPRAVSRSGAKGLMQLMDGTARDLGVTDSFDPAQNLDAGCRFMRHLLDRFGDYEKALVAYNWGPGNLQKAIAQHGDNWRAYISDQARLYLKKILGESKPAPQPLPDPPKEDPVVALRDETWALANRWADLGWPWVSQSMKGLVALSKGEK
jgi:hypothetical protein